MRIAIFDPYLDTLGGGEKYMLSAASFLSKDHEVSLLWDNKHILQRAKERFSLDLTKINIAKNIFSPTVNLLERYLQAQKYDRIFYLSDGSIPLVGKNKLLIHFQFPVEWVNGASFLNQYKLHTAKKIICNSEFTKTYIDKKFHISSAVLYPPSHVDTKLYAKKENIILSVGRFSRSVEGVLFKKQDVMITVFKKMVDAGFKNWNLVLVISYKESDKTYIADLKKMTTGYPVEIIENCSSKELDIWYSRAKIYWHAAGFSEDLERNPEKAEHFGIATVEAMAKGAVPIVINAGGQKEIVRNDENGYVWNSLDELIQQTQKISSNVSLEKKLSEQSVKDSQAFSEEKFYEHLQKLII